ncbi:MAG: hypothetical protein K6G51_04250 [Sphaerochaetaceae bacterium]|nr:hypothetical protein [Sphaerochaetaceae bacterium]
MRRITISDYTLKELGGSGKSQLLFREKLAIALGLCRYGADVIELPYIKNPREDKIVAKTISESVKNRIIAIPAGIKVEEVKLAAESIKSAFHPRLQISLPVSTVQMEYLYRLKEPKLLEKLKELVLAARGVCEDVEFEALDATRSDKEILIQACKAAKEAGAGIITISDDAGILMPEDFALLVKEIKENVKLPVMVKVSDSISLAVANALQAIKAGVDGVKVSINGKDALKIDSFAQALKIKGSDLDIATNLRFTELHSDIESMLKKIQNKKKEEEDFHLDGSAIFLDSESSIEQVTEAVKSLGYDLSPDDNGKVYEALMSLCEKKSSISSKELEAIIASSAMQFPATYNLISFVVTTSNKVNSVTNVVLDKGGENLSGNGVGGGPIDSAFMAIEQCVGHQYEVDDFQIQAVTEGKESLGSALVRLRSDGKLYSGNGLSSDIVGASIRAYINALNKIAYEESQK